MGFLKNKKIVILLEIVFFSLIAFLVGSATTTSPFYGDINVIDEGQFGAWANFMLHGKFMFKDMYIVYGPLYVYPLYILFKIFHPSAFLVRVYIECGGILGIIALNLLMKELQIRTFFRYILNILIILLPVMILRQAVGWFTIYLLILMATTKRVSYTFMTGLVAAISFLISPDIGIIVGILIAFFYIYRILFSSNIYNEIRSLFYFLIGFILILLLFILWAGLEGWLTAYVASTITQLIDFSGMNVPNGENLPNIFSLISYVKTPEMFIKFIFSQSLLIYFIILLHVIVLTLLTIKLLLRTITQNDKKIFLFLLYALFLLYISVRTPDISHLYFTLSPILLISVYYLDKCLKTLKQKNATLANQIPYIVILTIISTFYLRMLYINHLQILSLKDVPNAIFNEPNNPRYVGSIHISNQQKKYFTDLQTYVNHNSTIHDKIFIFTDEPMLYLILNRDNATKYVLPFAAVTVPMRDDLLRDLKVNKPKYIFLDKNAWNIDGISNKRRLPEIIHFITLKYKVIKKIDGVIIYKNNSYD